MHNKYLQRIVVAFILFGQVYFAQNKISKEVGIKKTDKKHIKFDDTRKIKWSKSFKIVEIKSKLDSNIQMAYFFQQNKKNPNR